MSATDLYRSAEAALREKRAQWERRLAAIQADRRRASAPLEQDFAEQAVQRENDATLDALDARGRQELADVEAALGRIEAGVYGSCVHCGSEIAADRLAAEPTAEACLPCARRSAEGP